MQTPGSGAWLFMTSGTESETSKKRKKALRRLAKQPTYMRTIREHCPPVQQPVRED